MANLANQNVNAAEMTANAAPCKSEQIAELLYLDSESVETSGEKAIISYQGIGDETAILTIFPDHYGRSVSVDIDLRDCKSILTADESYILRDIYLNEYSIAKILTSRYED